MFFSLVPLAVFTAPSAESRHLDFRLISNQRRGECDVIVWVWRTSAHGRLYAGWWKIPSAQELAVSRERKLAHCGNKQTNLAGALGAHILRGFLLDLGIISLFSYLLILYVSSCSPGLVPMGAILLCVWSAGLADSCCEPACSKWLCRRWRHVPWGPSAVSTVCRAREHGS